MGPSALLYAWGSSLSVASLEDDCLFSGNDSRTCRIHNTFSALAAALAALQPPYYACPQLKQ
jgi:hypothetical protein